MPYIDVDAIQRTIQEIKKEFAPNYRPVLEVAAHLISQTPIADVVAVRHGEWVYDHWCEFSCSECGHFSKTEPRGKENYCPNCGAKMDGGKDSDQV